MLLINSKKCNLVKSPVVQWIHSGLSFSVLPTWFIVRAEATTGNTWIFRQSPSFMEKKTNYSSCGWMYGQEGGRGKRGRLGLGGGGLGREDDLRLWGAHWIDYHRPYWMPYTSPLIYPNLLILSQKFSMVVAHILDEFCTCIFPFLCVWILVHMSQRCQPPENSLFCTTPPSNVNSTPPHPHHHHHHLHLPPPPPHTPPQIDPAAKL